MEDLEVIAEECLPIDREIKHCCYCGIIYDKEWEKLLMNFKKLTGRTSGLPNELLKYKITSGACPPCYKSEIDKYI